MNYSLVNRPEAAVPAVTVDDITVLPRVKRPDPGLVQGRPVVSVTTAPGGFEGEGFPVRRAFAGVDAAAIDPFIMMDQMGEVEYAPYEPRGTDWHPHRGFETVTYIVDGTFIHQDTHGGGGTISNGDTALRGFYPTAVIIIDACVITGTNQVFDSIIGLEMPPVKRRTKSKQFSVFRPTGRICA